MIEYHGWVTLRFSDYHIGDNKQKEFIEKFKAYLKSEFMEAYNLFVNIISYNDCEMFRINGYHNHRGSQEFYPIQIFRWISENGSGSYGLLYIQDDEDTRSDFANQFRVWVLKRGKLTEREDTLLSPFFPECEKEYDESSPPIDYDFDEND